MATQKANPLTQKKLPVEADVPELLIKMGHGELGSLQVQAVGNLALIAFYYLLRIARPHKARQEANHSVQIGGCHVLQDR